MKSDFWKMHTTNLVALQLEGWAVNEIDEGEEYVYYLCTIPNVDKTYIIAFDYLGNRQ